MWMPFERRWRDLWLDAVLPSSRRVPGYAQADTSAFWARYPQAAPRLLQFGFRVALWVLFAGSLARHRSHPARLTVSQRQALLADTSCSDWYLLRQLIVVIKLIATLAAFTDPQVRQAASV
jgi:hypothetical protein